jgi:small subunit ribosomal protein S16
MLTIRMQRTGRSGNAMFRVVVQDARQTPTSGKVVELLGSYNPHAKTLSVNKEKAAFYLEHGAQPSPRAARLLQADGVKLPKWVVVSDGKQGKLRNPEKLRRNRPAEEAPVPAAAAQAPAEPEATEVATEPEATADVE